MHLCFAIPWGTSWKPFAMFFHMIWTQVWLSLFHYSWSFICVLFHVITWLLSCFYQDYVFHAHVLISFDLSTQCLHRWSRLCRCMSPQKLFFCYHLPTRGRAGVKLGDAWYVSNVSIIFDAPCLFLHHLLSVFYTSWHFYAFSGTNLLTRCHSAIPLFSAAFNVSKKLHRKYSRNWKKQKPNVPILNEAFRSPKRIRRGAKGRPHHRAARPAPGLHPLWVRPPWSTSDVAPSPIKTPRREKPKHPINFPKKHRDPPPLSTRDWEGPEALPGTLPEREIATGALLHRHACLRCDEWVVYLELWVHSSS
jgi:hypothetical protein